MGPESGLSIGTEAGVEEYQEPTEEAQAPSERLHDLLSHTPAELQAASREDVEAFEEQLVASMKENGFSAKTFARTAENFPAPLQRKLRNPQVVLENTLSHINDLRRLCRERFAREQAEFERQERERLRQQQEQEWEETVRQQALQKEEEYREAYATMQKAEAYGETAFTDWLYSRQPRDAAGRPQELAPGDQALVDRVEASIRGQSEKSRDFIELTSRLERGFALWLQEYEIFGQDILEVAGPVTKLDDISRHVDVAVQHHIPEVAKGIGIDFSVTGSDVELAKKLHHTFDHPTVRLKYGTQYFLPRQELITLVLTMDVNRAKRLLQRSNFMGVYDDGNPIHQSMRKSFDDISMRFHDREIVQYTLVEEAAAQVRQQITEMESGGVSDELTADHRSLLRHLEQLLEDRKSLRDMANAEVEKESVKHVYRTRDSYFIEQVASAAA